MISKFLALFKPAPKKTPTYSVDELIRMLQTFETTDAQGFHALSKLVEEEIVLYSTEDKKRLFAEHVHALTRIVNDIPDLTDKK